MLPPIHPHDDSITYVDTAKVRRSTSGSVSHVHQSRIAFQALQSVGRNRYGACELCGTTRLRVSIRTGKPFAHDVHHKDGNRNNFRLDNLAILCRDCHKMIEAALRTLYKRTQTVSIRTAVSDQEPQAPTLRVITTAQESEDHRICREFYRTADVVNAGRDDYTPYNGWLPPETVESMWEKRRTKAPFTADPPTRIDWSGAESNPVADEPEVDDEDIEDGADEDQDDEPDKGWINEPPEGPDNEKDERAISPFIVNATLD